MLEKATWVAHDAYWQVRRTFLRDVAAQQVVRFRRQGSLSSGQKTLVACGVTAVSLPLRSPNLNAYVERAIRTIRQECLDHFIVFFQRHLDVLLREYLAHDHEERPHQGLNNETLVERRCDATGPIQKQPHLGGLLNHYSRRAA